MSRVAPSLQGEGVVNDGKDRVKRVKQAVRPRFNVPCLGNFSIYA